jgi:hypothetical protein
MGGVTSVLNALSCSDCARYVCNAMHCHSKCGENCCELDIDTEEVELPEGGDIEIEVQGCCLARKT